MPARSASSWTASTRSRNLKNLFSLRAAARLAKSLIPASFLAVFAVQRIARQLTMPPFSTARLELLGSDVYGLLLAAAWLLFGWSAIDYLVEWQSRESRLKMSREDLRDEYKETEGNPQIRGRIRNLQRQMRRRRVKADVSKAAVVLTNPTHYAVALGFDFATMEAPKVLAKGRNLLAEEIKAEARWAGVPIIENPPLARSLYRSVEVGQADSGRSLCSGGRDSGLSLPPARGGRAARAPRPRSRGPRQRSGRRPARSGVRPAAADSQEVRNEHDSLGRRYPARRSRSAAAARVRAAAGGHQRDLRHAGAAAGRRPGLSAGALDGRLDHRLSLRGADSPRRRAVASFPPCCCC